MADAATDRLRATIHNWLFAPVAVGLTVDFTTTIVAPQRFTHDKIGQSDGFPEPFEKRISHAIDPREAQTLYRSHRGGITGATGPVDREGIRTTYESLDAWTFPDRYRDYQLAVAGGFVVAAYSDSLFVVSAIGRNRSHNRPFIEHIVASFASDVKLAAAAPPVGHAGPLIDALDLGG